MKIFDFKNPRHVEILREELARAKRMLREYNESDQWKEMPKEYRDYILRSVDNNMGNAFAEEYANTDWMKLPDVVTNVIHMDKFALPEKYSKNALANIVEENKAKLGNISVSNVGHNVSDVIRFLRIGNPSKYYAYQVLAALFDNRIMVNMEDLEEQPGYQGSAGAGDQSIIGNWIQQDRRDGKNYGFD